MNRQVFLPSARSPFVLVRVPRVVLAMVLGGPLAVYAQRPPSGGGPPSQSPIQRTTTGSLSSAGESTVDLQVSVREPSGMPLAGNALVKVSSSIRGSYLTMPTQENSTASFPSLLAGEYDIEVSALGYQTAKEHTSLFAAGTTSTIYIYLHTENEIAGSPAPGAPIMTPRLQREMDKGLDKMRKREYDAARTQFEKAAKIAPANPDIQYLLGMVEYAQEHFDAAKAKFHAALSIYPSHERSLLGLGELQLRTGDAAGAIENLEKAYLINGADWRGHLLLADAYAQQKNYEKAFPHAKRAAELAKERGAPAWLLVGKILMSEEHPEVARQAFANVIRGFPNDPAAAEAKKLLDSVGRESVTAVSTETAASAALAELPVTPPPAGPVRPWAPPDVDAKEYPAVQDVACSENDLIQHTQMKMMSQLGNFEKFLATEHIEHQEVNAYGIPGEAREKDFNYLVFVEHPRPNLVYLEEKRDGGENLTAFPTPLATEGLFALAVNVFSANFQNDLVYKCEGLGTWRGQAAWRLRFEEKKGEPSHLRAWKNSRGTYQIPLKGRVWINAASYDVLHIETDLRDAVPDIQLTRDHLLIDYGPVKFERSGTTLWLPWDAEMFLELHGKRYHHTHALRNYMLFSVDTDNTIAKPKQAPENEKPQE